MTRLAGPEPSPEDLARDDEQLVRRLLAAAGPPPPAPEIEIARIQEAARGEWRRRYAWRRERRRLRWRWAAAAATIVVAAGLIWSTRGPRLAMPAGAALARVELVDGDVRFTPRGSAAARELAAGEELAAGMVGTGEGARLALRWADGRSLRLDGGSELLLDGDRGVGLRRGGLYVDSAGGRPGGGPTVTTAHGRFVEIGTQFEVRVAGDGELDARLRVREGAVEFRDDGRRETASAGVELTIGAGGAVRRGAVPIHGAAWAWVLDTAPVPDVEGWTLARFLAWYGRESGLEVAYIDAASARLAAQVVLHGATARLRPDEVLAAAAESAGFDVRAAGGRLVAAAADLAP